MFSILNKTETLRTAKAQAALKSAIPIAEILESRKGPKGDALEVAKVAGILAAKRTWEIIPYCHPIPIDHIAIEFVTSNTTPKGQEVRVIATVSAVSKTGVEMEALVAAQIAAITLFDMLKPLGMAMEITDVKVLEKTGGKSSFEETVPENFKAAVLVTSDGTFAGQRKDRSGQIIKERLEKFGIQSVAYQIVPDEKEAILQALHQWEKEKYDLVLTTGGTGLGLRDVTVEATQAFVDQIVPGIMETARGFGQRRTPYAMLSRGVAGFKGKMLVVNLPGSSRGTLESLDAIFPAILHGFRMMAGGGHGEDQKSNIKHQKYGEEKS